MLDEYGVIFDDMVKRTEGAVENLRHSLAGLRTGRASISLLDPVKVEAYGSLLPLNQLGTVTSPEPRMLVIQVWSNDMVKHIEKAIVGAGLGLNAIVEGQFIRIPLPNLSEERRRELVKKAKEYAEQCRVAIRNVRRSIIEELRGKAKSKEISEDVLAGYTEKAQDITNSCIAKVDELLTKKSSEIMEV